MSKTKKSKKRDTSYSETGKIIDRYGLETIRDLGKQYGMYMAAEKLKTSPYVVRYIAQTHGWKRPAEACQNLVLGAKRGKVNPDYYKNLDGSNVEIESETKNLIKGEKNGK